MYFLDTNVFRILETYYPSRLKSFWIAFNETVKKGEILSVEYVLKEIENGSASEHLLDWVDRNKTIFRSPTEEELQFISEIFKVHRFQDLIPEKKRLLGLPVADPFLIAAAGVDDGCVVTQESMKPNGVDIPNVCKYFEICCINLENLMERKNWEF